MTTGGKAPLPTIWAKQDSNLDLIFLREAVLSLKIDGTQTTFQGLLSVKTGQLSLFRAMVDCRESHNFVSALDYGLKNIETLPMSTHLAQENYTILMVGVGGEHTPPADTQQNKRCHNDQG